MDFTPVKEVTKGAANISIFRYGSGERKVKLSEIVKEYLINNDLTYGSSIDTFDVLKEFGITLTDEIKTDGNKYMQYFNLAKAMGDEFVRHLDMFGFKSDKKKKPASEGFDNNRHINGNIVYTNWPWTVVGKALKATEESINAMKGVHDENVDLNVWREYSPVEYSRWKSLAANKLSFARNEMEHWKIGFDEEARELIEIIESDIEEKKRFFKNLQPENYGRYQ
jgi:hypothetical protein